MSGATWSRHGGWSGWMLLPLNSKKIPCNSQFKSMSNVLSCLGVHVSFEDIYIYIILELGSFLSHGQVSRLTADWQISRRGTYGGYKRNIKTGDLKHRLMDEVVRFISLQPYVDWCSMQQLCNWVLQPQLHHCHRSKLEELKEGVKALKIPDYDPAGHPSGTVLVRIRSDLLLCAEYFRIGFTYIYIIIYIYIYNHIYIYVHTCMWTSHVWTHLVEP